MAHVPVTRTDGAEEALRSSLDLRGGPAQAQQHCDQDDEAHGVEPEHDSRPDLRDDQAGQRGTHRTGAVDRDAAQCRRGAHVRGRNELLDERLGRRQGQRDAAAQQEGERQE
jgi:hypothetical protein